MHKVRILIADDHAVMRKGISMILSHYPRFLLVGEAVDGLEALSLVSSLKPDVVIMDISMPLLDGFEATKRITSEHPGAKVVIFTMHNDHLYALNAFRAGAMAYVLKNSDPNDLPLAIDKAVNNKRFASASMSDVLFDDLAEMIKKDSPAEPFDTLSNREKEVLTLLAQGLKNKEVADRLNIAESTVKTHRIHLMHKLDVADFAGLVKTAISKGLVRMH